jgi:hypothetical protein
MEIRIPNDQYEKLALRAVAECYSDVPTFIEALADESIEDPRGPLSTEAIRQSVAELEAADTSIDAGQGTDAKEALQQIARSMALEIGA